MSESNQVRRPTVGDVAIAVAKVIKDAGKIERFDPIEHCRHEGRDFIRMYASKGVTHSVYLPAPAAARAGTATVADMVRNAGFRVQAFMESSPHFSGGMPTIAAYPAHQAG